MIPTTKEEFEAEYRRVAGFGSEWEIEIEPCDCGEPNCKGWQIVQAPYRRRLYLVK